MVTMYQGPTSFAEPRPRRFISVIALLLVASLAGCAHNNPRDPLEPVNRVVYTFNDGLDTTVIKPIAIGYRAILPDFARTGIGNFFSNLEDITVFINGVLQLKLEQAVSDAGRFLINSTVGLLGFFDVGTQLGLEKHYEDFGQTLGYWGMGDGPYLVLPFLGPRTLRDAVGWWVDSYTDPVWRQDHVRTRNQFLATRWTDNRARLLDSEKVFDAAAIDPYTFIREAYLQRRRNLIYDGNPPPEPEDNELPAQPRSEAVPTSETVLVDQFGNTVASTQSAPSSVIPVRTEATATSLAQTERPTTSAERKRAVPVRATAVDSRDAGSTSADTQPQRSTRIVKIWLP